MFLYVLIEAIQNRLKLINNTHFFDPYISAYLNIANNLSVKAEHHQNTRHNPDMDNIKVLCRALNRDGGEGP